jgi:hypothetical protein
MTIKRGDHGGTTGKDPVVSNFGLHVDLADATPFE